MSEKITVTFTQTLRAERDFDLEDLAEYFPAVSGMTPDAALAWLRVHAGEDFDAYDGLCGYLDEKHEVAGTVLVFGRVVGDND